MSESNVEAKVKYDQHSLKLKMLNQGDRVLCQNVKSRRWDKSRTIVEAHTFITRNLGRASVPKVS